MFPAMYRRLFFIREIEENVILKLVFGATVFSYFTAFRTWIDSSAVSIDSITNGTYVCKPYFQSCADWYFLQALPHGYSQSFFYMALFATLLATSYFMFKQDWVRAHAALLPSFSWHAFVVFGLTELGVGNYDYYLIIFGGSILFLPHKEFFLKLFLVLFYFLSTSAKIHETWILGTYFSALKTGLPLFPDWSIPFWTNLIILVEMVGSWLLLSRNTWLQRTVLVFFVIFHLYSGILVGYRYPATVLPTLFILFGPLYRFTPVPIDARSIVGWFFVSLIVLSQMVPVIIYGDEKLTLEGNTYGLYMFEANHQCISTARIVLQDGKEHEFRQESISSRDRCNPYWYWFKLHTVCKGTTNVSKIAWTFDHSINGDPFQRIVDVENACALSYHAFSHNNWIKTERENPTIIGYPVENIYD